jgi:hypothetical protein
MDPLTIIGIATTAIKTGEELYSFVGNVITSLKQNKELTQAESDALDALIANAGSKAWWKPEATA